MTTHLFEEQYVCEKWLGNRFCGFRGQPKLLKNCAISMWPVKGPGWGCSLWAAALVRLDAPPHECVSGGAHSTFESRTPALGVIYD